MRHLNLALILFMPAVAFAGGPSGGLFTPGLSCGGASVTAVGSSYLASPHCFTLRASTATYIGANGVMATAAANIPRVNYNPSTLALQGVLLEESRTNSTPYSSDLTHWNASGTYTLNAATTAPDGTTANSVVKTGTGLGGVWEYVSSAPNTTYTLSGYVKYISGTSITVRVGSDNLGNSGQAYIEFNPQTGGSVVQTGANLVSSNVTSAGSGWYRWVIVATSDSTSVHISMINYNHGIGEVGYWGLQSESGATATSYIQTTSTAAVTRAADVYQLP